MKTLVYSAEEEQELMARLWSPAIKNNLLNFVLFTFPWGKEGTPLEHFDGPRRWQRDVLVELTEHIRQNNGKLDFDVMQYAVSSGRGVGKSALVAWLVLWMMTTRIGSTSIVSANNENQLRQVTWAEMMKWLNLAINSHWFEPLATRIDPAKWLRALVEDELRMGTRYWCIEGKLWSAENPSAYAGVHNHQGVLLIFDEASGIDDTIWDVAKGFFTEKTPNRFWYAFSNPRRNSGFFYETFNAKRAFWKSKTVDAREVEHNDIKLYESIIAEHGSESYQAYVEVYGQFHFAEEDQFISGLVVRDAMQRETRKNEYASVVVGIDPSFGKRDATVIVVRRADEILAIKRYKLEDILDITGVIIEAIEEYKPALVNIDVGGGGYNIISLLKEQRYKVRGVDFGSSSRTPQMYANKRAEMWGVMRDWLKSATLPRDEQLRVDLVGPKMKFNRSGSILLESKEDMRGRGLASPDAGDALALTFAFPVARRDDIKRETSTRVVSGYSQINCPQSWMLS